MPKNLVICCDGTNNQFGRENTNVVRVIQALVRWRQARCRMRRMAAFRQLRIGQSILGDTALDRSPLTLP